ncbi:hypothetical protein EJB05_02318, partial [Eragrostis curvula]
MQPLLPDQNTISDPKEYYMNYPMRSASSVNNKKSEQAPPGWLSILEVHICSMYLDDVVHAAPAPSFWSAKSECARPNSCGCVPTHAELSFNAADLELGSWNLGMTNLNMEPLFPDQNTISDPKEYYMN